MNKAFVFDMDGVIVDSENGWKKHENSFLEKLLSKKISDKVGDTIGLTVNAIYDKARPLGFTMSREKFQEINDKGAFNVYSHAYIVPKVKLLTDFLIKNNFKLGLVSSSSSRSINRVLRRLSLEDEFESVISLNERPDLRHKPYPDGYIETMKILDSRPNATIILEDSNRGITAAKATGAFTIAFTQNLVDGYKQIDADAKADTIEEVIEVVRKHLK